MDSLLTATAAHWNNPTGAAWELAAAGIECSPPDPLGLQEAQAYPVDKLFMARQVFTRYTACAAGDRLVIGATTYVVKAMHPWAAQGGMDKFYHIVVEEKL